MSVSSVERNRWHPVLTPEAQEKHETPTGEAILAEIPQIPGLLSAIFRLIEAHRNEIRAQPASLAAIRSVFTPRQSPDLFSPRSGPRAQIALLREGRAGRRPWPTVHWLIQPNPAGFLEARLQGASKSILAVRLPGMLPPLEPGRPDATEANAGSRFGIGRAGAHQ
jgi:hypothetical protein